MFDSVLIANRGEIARRVIRTLDRLGIDSIAVFTEVDATAPFVREASRAVAIGSYLDVEAVIDACRADGCAGAAPRLRLSVGEPGAGAGVRGGRDRVRRPACRGRSS